ncbi:MAG TPA: hypothetical protein VL523_01435 [Terriglobia bacterium]|nr:hypothetical protein [Terriglobia bacterium]
MSLLSRIRGIDRKRWHVCYNCMMQTGHDTAMSVFYSEGPPALVLGRPMMLCPRCGNNNTKSFQTLKDEGSEAPLWGLEQTVRKYPRSRFIVKPQPAPGPGAAGAPSGTRH